MAGLKNIVGYVTSKGSILQMTKALTNECAEYGITAVYPILCYRQMIYVDGGWTMN